MQGSEGGFQGIVKLLCKEHEHLMIQIENLSEENQHLRSQILRSPGAASSWAGEGAMRNLSMISSGQGGVTPPPKAVSLNLTSEVNLLALSERSECAQDLQRGVPSQSSTRALSKRSKTAEMSVAELFAAPPDPDYLPPAPQRGVCNANERPSGDIDGALSDSEANSSSTPIGNGFGPVGMRRTTPRNSQQIMRSDRHSRWITQLMTEGWDPARKRRKGNLFRKRSLVINPECSGFLEVWDMVTMASLVFVALVAPVQVAMFEARIDMLFVANSFVDMIFLTDLTLQFFIMYPKKTNYGYALEQSHKNIVKHYLKTWFVIDFASIIPFDLVGLISESEEMKKMKGVKVIRLLRLLKLARVLKASRLFRRFEIRMSITYGTFALLKFFCILLLITHWLANLWALTLALVDAGEGIPRWIDDFDELDRNVVVKTRDSPVKLYITCLYFTSYTITSVGYGDIGPKNIVETIVCTVMLVISGISWAVVLGQVCGTIANLNKDEQAFRSTMDELNVMMSDRVMPPEMRRRLRSFFLSNKLAQRRARHMRVVEAMSPGLKGQVVMELNRVWIRKVSFLEVILQEAEVSDKGSYFYSFVVDVSVQLQARCFAQGEVFGSVQALCILSRGLVSKGGRLHSAGAVWGKDFVLSDIKLLEPSDSLALTYVEVLSINRDNFLHLVEVHNISCPGLKAKVRWFCCWLAFQRALIYESKRRRRELTKRDLASDFFRSSTNTGNGGRLC
uniref:Ion transport domain-containing protein n=1 Tax=Zooxanthella nutricula TaxID=1333877 RepID=A0A7S2K5J3_9DINO|mmetsp:Transcript_42262/g.127698  ORF Transcript_42262/g.127698 Transcript_42262/m.127698 type:complete len:735 (+) Transcript_42262:121-2325(+)